MSVGAIGSSYANSYSPYSTIAAGGQLQSAAQDAAGLAIEKKTETQTKGLDQGTENLGAAKSALNIEDGAMEGITDYLQSIKELAVQAKNGLLSDEDRGYIQNQIDQYIQGINDLAGSTSFNEKKLLDGSTGNMQIATDSNGSSMSVNTYETTAQKLGIEGFDVTSGDFDTKVIDDALSKVQENRATVGAQTNAVDHAMSYNSKASLELNGFSMDREEDRSIKAVQDLKAKQVIDQYQVMLQKKQQEDEAQKANMFFA